MDVSLSLKRSLWPYIFPGVSNGIYSSGECDGRQRVSQSREREEAQMIEPGSKAPEFRLSPGEGKEVWLKDSLGKWVVLFFYVKDNTSG